MCPAVRAGQSAPEEKDFFRFRVDSPGAIALRIDTINLNAGDTAANLAAEIELWRKIAGTWQPLRTSGAQPAADLSAWIAWQVPVDQTGEYAVGAKSRGGYGDLGKYVVTVTGNGVNEVSAATLALPRRTRPA